MVSGIVNIALRGFQALFAIVVLGLSITLIRGHHIGSLPASLGYAAFVGGISLVAALVGLAATWFEFLGGIVGLAVDGVVAVINIAGGVVFAVKLRGISCGFNQHSSDWAKAAYHEFFSGGCSDDGDVTRCWNADDDVGKMLDRYRGHCREAQANTVFMFLTAAVMLVCALMVFLRMRKGY